MASTAIKKAASTADDLSTIGTFLSKLGGAEVELAKAQNQGGLSEADAVKAALARKQIAETMQEVKDLFVMSGNGHLYQQCMQEMANARKAKQEELARATAKNKKVLERYAPDRDACLAGCCFSTRCCRRIVGLFDPMIMAFLLIVIVDGEPLKEEFYFRDVTRCNQFAYYVESGAVKIGKQERNQNNISAYCIPKKIGRNTKTWD